MARPAIPSLGTLVVRVTLLLVALSAASAFADDGLQLVSKDGNVALRIGGVLQLDGRIYGPDGVNQDQFLIRRALPILEARLFDRVTVRLMPDLAPAGGVTLLDAFVEATYADWLKVKVGKFFVGVGLERLRCPWNLLFLEFGLPSDINPDRDVGIQVNGRILDGRVGYAVGLFNGVADGATGGFAIDGNKDLAGRLYVQPFKGTALAPLEGLIAGVGGSWGTHEGTNTNSFLPTYRTGGQAVFFSYGPNSLADGTSLRVSPHVYYTWGPASLMFEYAFSAQDVTAVSQHGTARARAWQAAAGYVVTGGNASWEGVVPEHPLSLSDRTFGDVEVAARFNLLTIDPSAFSLGFPAAGSVNEAEAVGVGVNWYASGNIRVGINFEYTAFPGTPRLPEEAFFLRLQATY